MDTCGPAVGLLHLLRHRLVTGDALQLTAARCNTHAHAFTVWTRANTHSHARTHTRLLNTSTHSHIHTRTHIYCVDTCRPATSLPRLLLLPTNSLPRLLMSTAPTTIVYCTYYVNLILPRLLLLFLVYHAYYFSLPRLLLLPTNSLPHLLLPSTPTAYVYLTYCFNLRLPHLPLLL